MAEDIRFSVIVHMEGLIRDYFRGFLESLAQSTYKNFELIITDATGVESNGSIAAEFFPESGRLIYRKVRPKRSRGYALNYALSLAKGDYFIVFDRHSRISPIALFEMSKAIADKGAMIVYPDNDELEGNNRINPDFKSGPNIELLRHRNYIGDVFAFSKELIKSQGAFRDSLNTAALYDLLLRGFESKSEICHIPKLLYSKRIIKGNENKDFLQKQMEAALKEHMAVVGAHLRRMEIEGEVRSSRRTTYWNIDYDGSGYRGRRRDYMVLRDPGVRVRLKDALPKMYSILKQDDVAVVGCTILSSPFSYDNCGYIFDGSGNIYPACQGQSILYDGYGLRCIIPRDVSLVDFGFCLVKTRVYKGLNGFDRTLTGRDAWLDFCLRAKRAGYRTVFDPRVKARRRGAEEASDITSNERLMEKWGDYISLGDPFYNKNLPMGIDNYFLY